MSRTETWHGEQKKHFAHLAKITIFNINNLKGGKSEKEPAIAVNFVEDFQIEKKRLIPAALPSYLIKVLISSRLLFHLNFSLEKLI